MGMPLIVLALAGEACPAQSLAITGAKAYRQPGESPIEDATILVVNGKCRLLEPTSRCQSACTSSKLKDEW
jgi:hypothetical protein